MNPLLNLDYLVYSAHKTMTQTLKESLCASGFRTLHCHRFTKNFPSPPPFAAAVNAYNAHHKAKLKVISVFRDPLDRVFSSFFQSLSVDEFGRTGTELKALDRPENSILFREDMAQITERFLTYCRKANGVGESIQILCHETGSALSAIDFDETRNSGGYSHPDFDLSVMRYDLLQTDIQGNLERITGSPITVTPHNVSSQKWYFSHYTDFRRRVRLPKEVISTLYEDRRQLMDIFYKGRFDAILADKIREYGL